MAQVGQTTTQTTIGSGGAGGPANAFAFNKGDEPVSGVVAPGDGNADPSGDNEGEGQRPAPELLEARDQASRVGWVDQEAWVAEGKDPSRWRDAPDFLDWRRGIQKINAEENSAQRAEIALLKQKLAERERKEAEAQGRYTIETLKLERKQARENNDWDKVDELDDKIDGLRQEQSKLPPAPAMPAEMQSLLVSFRDQNEWLQKDPDLAADFTRELKAYVDSGTGLERALQRAKARIIRDNPTKFGNGNAAAPRRFPMAETGGNAGHVSGGRQWANLKPEWRRQAEADIAKGKYTKDEYLRLAADEPGAWTK